MISVANRQKWEILTAAGHVVTGATPARNGAYWESLALLTATYAFLKHRRAKSGPPAQIPLALQEVLPHPAGRAGGGVPRALGRRRQALPRGVQCKLICANAPDARPLSSWLFAQLLKNRTKNLQGPALFCISHEVFSL